MSGSSESIEWRRRGFAAVRWWETSLPIEPGPRGVLMRLKTRRALVWWICVDGERVAEGEVGLEPDEELEAGLARAQRAVWARWRELGL